MHAILQIGMLSIECVIHKMLNAIYRFDFIYIMYNYQDKNLNALK